MGRRGGMATPNIPVRATPMSRIPGTYLASLYLSLGMFSGCQTGAGPGEAPASKLNPQLVAAAQAVQQGASSSAHTDAQGRMQVYVYVTDLGAETLGKLTQAGLVDPQSTPEMALVQGWIAPDKLDALAALACVKTVTLPRYAKPR